jgi:hypothetical protein
MTLEEILAFIADHRQLAQAGILNDSYKLDTINEYEAVKTVIVNIIEYINTVYLQYIMAYYQDSVIISQDSLLIIESVVIDEINTVQRKLDDYLLVFSAIENRNSNIMLTSNSLMESMFNKWAHKLYFDTYRNSERNASITEIYTKANYFDWPGLKQLADNLNCKIDIDAILLIQQFISWTVDQDTQNR